jgi:hypothetical protein
MILMTGERECELFFFPLRRRKIRKRGMTLAKKMTKKIIKNRKRDAKDEEKIELMNLLKTMTLHVIVVARRLNRLHVVVNHIKNL